MIELLIATSDRQKGGIQRALADQLSLLADDKDIAITVLSPQSDFTDLANKVGAEIIYLSDAGRRIARMAPVLSAAILGQRRFDRIICHNGFMAAFLRRHLRHSGSLIGLCHNDKPQQFTKADKLVCLTPKGIDNALSTGWPKHKLTSIPHYHIAASDRAERPPQRRPSDAPLRIGCAGRMVAKKNLDLFITIAGIVKQTRPHCQFQLAGTGQLSKQIEAKNNALGRPVEMLGWTDITSFLSEIDIFIVPSFDEPFGYVYLEAMSAAVAVLSSDSFGGDFILDGGGVAPVLAADDAHGFADEIGRLDDDRDALHIMQQQCYQRALSDVFARKTAYQSWRNLIG